jgi:hypothetical protein
MIRLENGKANENLHRGDETADDERNAPTLRRLPKSRVQVIQGWFYDGYHHFQRGFWWEDMDVNPRVYQEQCTC